MLTLANLGVTFAILCSLGFKKFFLGELRDTEVEVRLRSVILF